MEGHNCNDKLVNFGKIEIASFKNDHKTVGRTWEKTEIQVKYVVVERDTTS